MCRVCGGVFGGGEGREGKGREGEGREGKGREGKGRGEGTGEQVGVDVGDAGGFGGFVACGHVLVYRSALG